MGKRVTDLKRKEDAEKWKPRDNILIASPMGQERAIFAKTHCMILPNP